MREALADGRLDAGRFQSYLKLKRARIPRKKTDKRAMQQEKAVETDNESMKRTKQINEKALINGFSVFCCGNDSVHIVCLMDRFMIR
ncbi:hypothetical protein PO124_10655 [Bacillus licheniformis]|nr:hypothetical protein [Bacillus licheniformis]